MNIAITGAGGFIGSKLTAKLLKDGNSVSGIDRYFFGKHVILNFIDNPNFKAVKNDIRFLKPTDFNNIDTVIDLAGLSNDPSCDIDPQITRSINYNGALNVAKAAKDGGVKQYIFASSCSVYGFTGNSISTEVSPLNPVSYYAKLKAEAEQEVLKLADQNFCVTVFRIATLYGLSPRMRFDLAVNLMTLMAWKKRRIYIMGGGNQWRPLVNINDAVQAFSLLLNADKKNINGQVYNLGSTEQNFQIIRLAQTIQGIFNDVEIDILPDDEDKRSYQVCFKKIKADLNFTPNETPATSAKEIKKALQTAEVSDSLNTKTVQHYKYLIEADKILSEIKLDNKLF